MTLRELEAEALDVAHLFFIRVTRPLKGLASGAVFPTLKNMDVFARAYMDVFTAVGKTAPDVSPWVSSYDSFLYQAMTAVTSALIA